jgi:hypothetical protein
MNHVYGHTKVFCYIGLGNVLYVAFFTMVDFCWYFRKSWCGRKFLISFFESILPYRRMMSRNSNRSVQSMASLVIPNLGKYWTYIRYWIQSNWISHCFWWGQRLIRYVRFIVDDNDVFQLDWTILRKIQDSCQ